MNLRPLVLGVSLVAGIAPMVAFAQQTAPQPGDESDLGLTPSQLAEFAGRTNVVYAAPAMQPSFGPGQPAYEGAVMGHPELAPPQTLMMGYQAPTAGTPPSVQQVQPVNPKQMIAPNWPNANIPQPMMPGPPGDSGYGYGYGPGPPAVDGLVPGAPGGVDPYGGSLPPTDWLPAAVHLAPHGTCGATQSGCSAIGPTTTTSLRTSI